MVTRIDVVRTARSYIGTAFHHCGRAPGVGIDCAGVVICTMRELGLAPPGFDVPPYIPIPDGKSMLAQCDEYLTRVTQAAMQPGDVVVLITDQHPQHLGILADYQHGGLSIIHAATNAHPPRVIETRLMFSRAMRYVASYSLPSIA